MSANRSPVDHQLDRLEMAQLVRRSDDQEAAYLFKHTLTQETAYQSLLQKRRREVHRLVAQAYEIAYSERLPEIAAILAQHYAQSGDDAKTLTYAILAGDEAARVYANAEAVSYYTMALDVARRGGEELTVTLQDLYLKRGRVLEVSNQFADALSNYKQMEADGRSRSKLALVLAALIPQATVHSIASPLFDPAKGQELSDRALELAREMNDRKAEAKVLWNLMLLYYFMNKSAESVRYGEESLEIARALNLREQLAFTLSDISRSYVGVGRTERALVTQTEARGLWRELGNLPLLADNLSNSAGVHYNRGELDQAISLAEEALLISRQIGNIWGEVYAEQILGVLRLDRGEVGDALKFVLDSVARAEPIGALFAIPAGYSFLGWVYAKLGEPRKAIEYAKLAVDKGERTFPPFLPVGYAALAYAYFLNGDLTNADFYVDKSHENLDPRNFDFPQPYFVAVAEAEIKLAEGKLDAALKVVDQLLANLKELGIRGFVADSLFLKSRIVQAMNRAEEARSLLLEARPVAEGIGQNLVLLSILSSLSRLDMDAGNKDEGHSSRIRAKAIAEEIARKVPPELRDSFLRLPDVRYAVGS